MKFSKVEETKYSINDIVKCHINFLYKLHFFNQDFHNKINGNTNIKSNDEILYIINPNLIRTMKSIYFYNEIKQFFTKEKQINDIIALFPNDLINKIKNQNKDILKDEKLFNIHTVQFGDLDLKYYKDISLLNDNTISYLKQDQNLFNKLNSSRKITSVFSQKKLILIYEDVIHIGILDYNHIFIPEILILCTGKDNLKTISEEIKYNSIENFKNQTTIVGKKLGYDI